MFFYRNPLKWVQDQRLVAIDPSLILDSFGLEAAISADGSTVVFSSYTDGESTDKYDYNGSFYIFKKEGDQYREVYKFMGSEAGLYLGNNPTMTADGNKVAIGVSGDDTLAVDAGAIYMYESGSGGYVETQKILLADADPANDWIGWPKIRLDPTGEFLFVASVLDDDTGQSGGAVYILQSGSNGYQQIQKITSEDSSIFSLGHTLEISEDKQTLLAMAKGTTSGLYVQVYESGSSGYQFSQKLSLPVSYQSNDSDLRISQDKTRIVARTRGTVSPTYVSDILIFEKNQGSYELVQQISDSSEDAFWSLQLNSSGDMFAVGAIGYDNNGLSYAGGVFIYESGSNGFENVQTLTGGTTVAATGGARFGLSVAMNPEGTKIIVGAPSDETNGYAAGAGFYFKKVGTEFQLVQQLSSSSDWSPTNDYFGSVAFSITNNVLAVGARGDETNGGTNAGAVYIYQYENEQFEFKQKLVASEDDNPAGDRFGANMEFSSDGQVIFIGAYYDEENGGDYAGSVYVFQSSSLGYQQVQKLTASFEEDGSPERSPQHDRFGSAIATNTAGDVVFIKASSDETTGPESTDLFNTGSLYVFKSGSSGYQQVQKILPEDTGLQFGFPSAVVYSEQKNYLLLGQDVINEVHIYTSGSSGYEKIATLGPDASSLQQSALSFGNSVATNKSGTLLSVGAPVDSHGTATSNIGSVFIFQSSSAGYQQVQKLRPENPDNESLEFGSGNIFFSDDSKLLFVAAVSDSNTTDKNNVGSLIVFESSSLGYQQIDKIHSPIQENNLYTGGDAQCLNENGTHIVYGISRADIYTNNDGVVYTFKHTRDY